RAGFGRAGRAAHPGSPEPGRDRPHGNAAPPRPRGYGRRRRWHAACRAGGLSEDGPRSLPRGHRRQRAVRDEGPDARHARPRVHAIRSAVRRDRGGRPGGRARRLSGSPWTWTSTLSKRDQLPREHLRAQEAGVERVVSVSAVGSMKETLHPGHVVIPHQFYDQTKCRIGTFFERGLVAHVALADPVCRDEAGKLADGARQCGATVHEGGVSRWIEGRE